MVSASGSKIASLRGNRKSGVMGNTASAVKDEQVIVGGI